MTCLENALYTASLLLILTNNCASLFFICALNFHEPPSPLPRPHSTCTIYSLFRIILLAYCTWQRKPEIPKCWFWKDTVWSLLKHRNAQQPELLTGAEGHSGAFSAALGTAIPQPFPASKGQAPSSQPSHEPRHTRKKAEANAWTSSWKQFVPLFMEIFPYQPWKKIN